MQEIIKTFSLGENEVVDNKDKQIEHSEEFLLDISNRPSFFVESNIVYLPIFSFDKKHSEKSSKITHTIPVTINGSLVTTTFSVATSEILDGDKMVSLGLPGAFDMQILFCLMDIWDEQGRSEDGLIKFKLNHIRKKLNLTDAGKNYNDIRNSIKKLSNTKINSNKAFFSAERALHVDSTVGILTDPTFVDSKSSGSKEDFCTVFLSKHILGNLLKNYTTRVSRTLFHKLEVGFSQRILSLILFRQQNRNDSSNYIDYDLMELASMLPMSGKLFPSTIKDRLKVALQELKDKNVFTHEFIKIGSTHFIRFKPILEEEDYLIGSSYVSDFLKMIQYVYSINLLEFFNLSEEKLVKEVEKYNHVFSYNDRKYTWAYHVLDVLAVQIKGGYKIDSPQAFLLYSLKSSKLDYPMSYDKPIDVLYRQKKAKDDLTKAVVLKEKVQKDNDDEIFALSMKYSKMLNDKGKKHYTDKAKEKAPLLAGFQLDYEIADLISHDLKNKNNSEIFQFLDESKLQVQKLEHKNSL